MNNVSTLTKSSHWRKPWRRRPGLPINIKWKISKIEQDSSSSYSRYNCSVSCRFFTACVRWNLVYALGILIARFPSRMENVLPDILECLDDQNRIVRVFASKTLANVAACRPRIIEELFQKSGKEAPRLVDDILRNSGSSPGNVSKLPTIPGTNRPNLDI